MKTLFISLCLITAFYVQGQDFTIIERPSQLNGGAMSIGDLNGDGDDDFVIGRSTRRTYIGLRNELNEIEYEILDEGLWQTNITIYDFDGDGDNDIISAVSDEDLMILWQNDGSASFERVDLPYPDYKAIAFADLDSDGIDEMILGHGNRLEIFTVSTTNPTSLALLSDDPFIGSPAYLQILDNNQDGLKDIVGIFNRDGIRAYHQSSNFDFELKTIFEDTYNNNIFFPTDLNGDNIYDFVVKSDFGRDAALFLSQSNGEHAEYEIPAMDGIARFLLVEDLNQDGTDEIILGDGDFNQFVSLLTFENDSFSRKLFTSDYRDLNTPGLSDLNNDGLTDFLFFTRTNFNPNLIYCIQGDLSFLDEDGDSFTSEVDCNDNDPSIYPGAEEICDNKDNDCDGSTDEGLTYLSWWIDNDGDGFGSGPMEDRIVDCKKPDGYVQNYGDCDDTNKEIYPGAPEILDNEIDENCDGRDNGTATYNLEDVTIEVYPNPASDLVRIQQTNGKLDLAISIFDLNGKAILRDMNFNGFIRLEQFIAGSYILKIEDTKSNNFVIERLIIVK